MQEVIAQAAALDHEIAFLIKWDPRNLPVETIAAHRVADAGTQWVSEQAGKCEYLWQESVQLAGLGGPINPVRRVYRCAERSIGKHGHALLLPEYVLEGWTTTLPERLSCEEVIALYCDHAPHE